MSEVRLTYTVEEAAQLLGVGRGAAYQAVRTGELPAVRLGRRLLIPRHALDQLLRVPDAAPSGVNGKASQPQVKRESRLRQPALP